MNKTLISYMHAFQETIITPVLKTISFILLVSPMSETIETSVAQKKIFKKHHFFTQLHRGSFIINSKAICVGKTIFVISFVRKIFWDICFAY